MQGVVSSGSRRDRLAPSLAGLPIVETTGSGAANDKRYALPATDSVNIDHGTQVILVRSDSRPSGISHSRSLAGTPTWGITPRDMAATLHRFIALSPATADAEALWCLHTYVHDGASVSPNLCLSSPEKRCGKTRYLSRTDQFK